MEKYNERMKKYHPIIIGLLLGVIGLVALFVCIAIGIELTHWIGVLFSNWGADFNYFSDFLGGALGLTVGFVLDKLCIERINQVIKYSKLIKIVKTELVNLKGVVYWKETTDPQGTVVNEKLYVINKDGSIIPQNLYNPSVKARWLLVKTEGVCY